MDCYNIVAMRVEQRTETAAKMQQVLTEFGCNIKARLGLHEVSGDYCSNDGLVILQVCGESNEIEKMVEALNDLGGIRAKLINLN